MSRDDQFFRLLKKYKSLLVNFSRRNRELYYKPSKSSSLNLSEKVILNNEASTMSLEKFEKRFEPLSLSGDSLNAVLESGKYDLGQHFGLDLAPNPSVEKTIDKVRLADTKYQREYGISGSWLMGPFLAWHPSADSPPYKMAISPIFKIPIDIKRSGPGRHELILEESELALNPSLVQFFKDNLKINLKLFNKDNPRESLQNLIKAISDTGKEVAFIDRSDLDHIPKSPKLSEKIKDQDGNVIEEKELTLEEQLSGAELELYNSVTSHKFKIIDCLYVDQINASKTTLLTDYDEIIKDGDKHPILNELLIGSSVNSRDSNRKKTDRELNEYKESACNFVLDTDSSQHRAVDRISSERAIVIEGPPGTGKSQTITNMIADLVSKGKKILFVAEKRAALDVVSNRLNMTNLGSKTALVHSSDLDRPQLYKDFINSQKFEDYPETMYEWEALCSELDSLKKELASYQESLVELYAESGLNSQDIMALKSNLGEFEHLPISHLISKNKSYSENELISKRLNELKVIYDAIPEAQNCIWFWKSKDLLFNQKIESEVSELVCLVDSINQESSNLKSKSEMYKFDYLKIARFPRDKKYDLSSVPHKIWTNGRTKSFEQRIAELKVIKEKYDKLITSAGNVKAGCQIEILKPLVTYLEVPRGFVKFFTPSFWKMRAFGKRVFIKPGEWESYESARDAVELSELILESKQLFDESGVEFKCGATNFDKFKEIIDCSIYNNSTVFDLKTTLNSFSEIESETLNEAVEHFDRMFEFSQKAEDVQIQKKELEGKIRKLVDLDKFLAVRDYSLLDIPNLMKESVSYFDEINKFLGNIEVAASSLSVPELHEVIVNEIALSGSEEWGNCFKYQAIADWYDGVCKKSSIGIFDQNLEEKKIERYKRLVEKHKKLSRGIVHTKTQEYKSLLSDQGLKLLQKEAKKQRKVLSPREIMEKGALKDMLAIKPVWLMSPLSISQILPNEAGLFDYIIFDEASQVRVEDSIPSIYRAKKMVVVGDKEQMPPTMFFNSSVSDLDDDEDEEIPESILDLASLIYPSELLTWHYRSRQESLIAFSNRAFYGGRLIAAPSPDLKAESGCIAFKKVDDANFLSSKGNQVEAEAIVSTIAEKLGQNPDVSIGVIAMGKSQQKAIEEAIDARCVMDSNFKSLYNKASNKYVDGAYAGLFIKNLENCQGDERDDILISIGYAPPRLGAKLRKQFGPLSKKGGRRRLNVAITRAKASVTVFCSFNPAELESDEAAFSKNPDAATFSRYLKYTKFMSESEHLNARAILDQFPMSGLVTNKKPSRFALDVMRSLENEGFKVITEIGSSGYFIDLAVEHPKQAGAYIVGIECDGHIFHFHRRDKDIARQSLLESRGWKILRVDSIDWSKNREKEISRLVAKINQLSNGADELEALDEAG